MQMPSPFWSEQSFDELGTFEQKGPETDAEPRSNPKLAAAQSLTGLPLNNVLASYLESHPY